MTYSKLRFSKLKKFTSKSVFGELQLRQISLNFQISYCNLKVRGLGAKLWMAFLLFLLRKELWGFEVKDSIPCFLLNKNINFSKNETEWKLENPTHSFRGINHVLQLVQELPIKSKTVMSCSLQKKKRAHFLQRLFCLKGIFLIFVFYLYFHISKNIT